MSIEQMYADHTSALNRLAAAIEQQLAQGGVDAKTTNKPSDAKGAEGKQTETVEPIYYHNPKNSAEFGIAESEAEFKKLKKANAALVKTTQAKYDALVAAAEEQSTEETTSGSDSDVSERVQAIIDELPTEPGQDDIVAVFTRYIPKDLTDKDERTARTALIKPVLAKYKAARATEVTDKDRYNVMVDVTKALEAHLEETGQVDSEDDALV